MSTETITPEISEALRKRIVRLLVGRFVLGGGVLGATWIWRDTLLRKGVDGTSSPEALLALMGVLLTLSVGYLFIRRIDRNYLTQVKVQLWIDMLLISWLVWQTRGYVSPYTTLFIIITAVAGYFFSRRETFFFGLISTLAFLLLSLAAEWSTIFLNSPDRAQATQTIAFTAAGILTVALLSARLADKRRLGQELKETVESFADMRILHERIIESIDSGLITTDLEGTVRSFNRAAEEISGLQAKDILGKKVSDVLGESVRAPFELCLGAAETRDFSSGHFEAVIGTRAEDDRTKAVSIACTISPLVGKNRKLSGVIIAFQDLTDIRAMEEDLRRSDRLAAVGRMAAGLAHEIRNPLGSMSAALQFLKEKDTTDKADAELLDVALRESERLEQIIANFLAYARPTSQPYSKEDQTDTNLNLSLRDCQALLEHSPERKDSHVFEFALPDEPIVIHANPSQIKQVFWNLARNAIQAMPQGGTLRVELSRSGRNARITFEDTGKGIDPEYLEHIFEPFSDKASGTGLGLSIVHRIVTDHGGRIDIESEVSKGTKVVVEFP